MGTKLKDTHDKPAAGNLYLTVTSCTDYNLAVWYIVQCIYLYALAVPAPNKYQLSKSQWKTSPAFTIGYRRYNKSCEA